MLSPVPMAGVDVGKHFLDLGFHPAAKPMRCDNTPAGIERLIGTLRQRGVMRVALEAIGPYAQPLVQALVAAGFAVALVDPRRIKAFRTAEGLIAKTDRLDAALIARFAHRMSEFLRPVPTADQVALKALSTRRVITHAVCARGSEDARRPQHGGCVGALCRVGLADSLAEWAAAISNV